jgi:hypothetical protein
MRIMIALSLLWEMQLAAPPRPWHVPCGCSPIDRYCSPWMLNLSSIELFSGETP